jgi:HD-GYP domain-containing protein (c-di-GMP phosphodiesterase class II)
MLASSPQPLPIEDDYLRKVAATVRAGLGEDFTLWVRSESEWLGWPSGEPIDPDRRLDSVRVVETLDSVANRLAPTCVASVSERHVLAIPFVQAGVLTVAVASLATYELPDRLAAALQQGLARSLNMDDICSVADDCARQISEDMEHVVYLQTLSEHLQLCDISRSPLDVAQMVLPTLRDLIRAESVAFLIPSEESNDPGGDARKVATLAFRVGQEDIDAGTCCDLVQRFQSAAQQQPVAKNRLKGEIDGVCRPGLDSFLLIQIARNDIHTGWLLALNRSHDPERKYSDATFPTWGLSDGEFGTVESGLMLAAASMLATHACNVHVFHERERLLIGVLRSLIKTMDAKDSYTCGHSDRVALIARRLAEELGLSPEECNTIYISGLLHDIGKIGVPDSLLLKTSPLTKAEYVQIQQHSERGHSILKHLDNLVHALPGIRHHHERYDGFGYPSGLQGDLIPLPARILAVADSYDAMSSNRPYRKALPANEIEAILKEGAGSQWDPRIIETFLCVLPEIVAVGRIADIHTQVVLAASLLNTANVDMMHDNLSAILNMTHSP